MIVLICAPFIAVGNTIARMILVEGMIVDIFMIHATMTTDW
jgi:hypothetical protein